MGGGVGAERPSRGVDRADIERARDGWLEFLANKRRASKTTLRTYRSSVNCLLDLLLEHPTEADLDNALTLRLPSGQKAIRRNTYLALKSL